MVAPEHIPLDPRRTPNLSEKLASTLLLLTNPDGTPIISHEEARGLSTAAIIGRFQWDHYPIRWIDGGPTAPWNLMPRPTAGHGAKTASIDIPQIAKGKRLRRSEAAHAAVMAAKAGDEPPAAAGARPKRKMAGRPFGKQHRPMRGGSAFGRRP